MRRSDHRALLGGVVLLAAAATLLELLTFRLGALAVGWQLGLLVGLLGPTAMAGGGILLGRSPADAKGPEICRRASHLAAWGGAGVIAGAIGITWASQQVAFGEEMSGLVVVAVAVASFVLPAAPTGGALALMMRRGARQIGRFAYAEAVGGILGCVLIPVAEWGGFPRAMIAVGVLYAGAAALLMVAARPERVHGALIVTLPLVVTALIAGDVGAPWMKVRADHGRYPRFDRLVWTSQGAVTVERLEGTAARIGLDRTVPLRMARKHSPKVKPRFENTDLGYMIRKDTEGPTLAIASGGGHELDAGLAYGATHIDAIELHRGFTELLEDPSFVAYTGDPWADARVETRYGDGRASLDKLPGDYENVVVVGFHQPDLSVPRFVSRHQRLLTVEGLRAMMRRLTPSGRLTMLLPRETYPAVVAGIFRVLGIDREIGLHHVLACEGGRGAIVVASRSAFEPSEVSRMKKRCIQSRLQVRLPLRKEQPGPAGDKARASNRDALAALEAAVPATDDKPFHEPPPALATLPQQVGSALAELVPDLGVAPGRRDTQLRRDVKSPGFGREGLSLVGLLAALFVFVLGAVVGPPASGDARPRPPAALRWALPLIGGALALCIFSLGDRLLRVAGDGAYAWALVVPMGLVGVGAGRLWVDTMAPSRARRVVMIALAVSLVWLLLLHIVGMRLEGLVHRPEGVRLAMVGGLLFISGFLLGFPAAAVLRFLAEWDRAPVAWGWSMHALGWALGGAFASLAVPYVGVARLWPAGLACFAMGAALLTLGARVEPPPSKWYLRRLR